MSKLAWLIWIPFIASLASFSFPSQGGPFFRRLGLAFSLLPLLVLISFSPASWMGEQIHLNWVPSLSISFDLKVDPLSLLFLYLTALIIPLSLLTIAPQPASRVNLLYGLVFLLQGLLIGFFTAADLFLFVVFWEAMLFPLYFLITLFGREEVEEGNRRAAFQFLIYMIAGSSLMVAGVLGLYFASLAQGEGTFNIEKLAAIAPHSVYAPWICAVFLLAFAVKTPLFPFHGWLPDVYCQSSTSSTILLSSLLSKAGIYGFLKIALPFFPDIVEAWSPLLLGLAITGVLYGGLAAWGQGDYKRLIAYSSFSHVNFILAGIFVFSQMAHEGAVLQALNHGITIAALFMVAGWLEERLKSTEMAPFSGVVQEYPRLCWLTMVFVLSSVALPGTNSFVGELLILFGLFGSHPWLTFVLALTIILSVIYMLRWIQNLYFGPSKGGARGGETDIRLKEFAIAFPLVALIFWIGIYPAPVLKQVTAATEMGENSKGLRR